MLPHQCFQNLAFLGREAESGNLLRAWDFSLPESAHAPLFHGYGRRIDDPHMTALGAWSARELELFSRGVGDGLGRALPARFAREELAQAPAAPPLPQHGSNTRPLFGARISPRSLTTCRGV